MVTLQYYFLFVGFITLSAGYRLDEQHTDAISERVQLRVLSERSIDGGPTIHLSAFGEDHVLQLTPTEIFTPGFQLINVNSHSDGNLVFNKVEPEQTAETTARGQLYSVNDGKGSLYITEDGGFQAEGVINDNLRIIPIENDYHEDGSLAHTVHKIRTSDENNHLDFVIPEPSEIHFDQSTSSVFEDVPAEVTVEVLVVFDYANCKAMNFDQQQIKKYIAIFWSQINYRYRDTRKPKVNIAVSGLLTFNKPQDEPFIFKHRYGEDKVDKECLSAFVQWLAASKASLPKHDAAILQLGLDGGFYDDKGKWDSSYAGLAYVGTACATNGYNSGWAEDNARLFNGFNGVAHELAHILNCPHDGDGDAKACPVEQGFVMSGGWKKTFSTCSIDIMSKFFSSEERKCAWDKPTIAVPLIDVWPVLMIEDLNEQCRILMRSNEFYFPKKIMEEYCDILWCGKKGSNYHFSAGPASEGTPCAVNKVCLDKKCVSRPAPSLDQQCQQQFGNQFKASSKIVNVCADVRCTNTQTGKEQSLGRPIAGTPCGTQNLCLNGVCHAV